MGLFKKKKQNEDIEFEQKDLNKADKIKITISRLENQTKVESRKFWAMYEVDKNNNIAFWVNEKFKFKQPVSDYYLSKMNINDTKTSAELQKEISKLKEIYDNEVEKDIPSKAVNIHDIKHKIEVKEHELFLKRYAENGFSVVSRNTENFRQVEYLEIGNKLYPLAFNPTLMNYFIIPIDKQLTLDNHRENITVKHTSNMQKLIASATILMLILTVVLALITGIAAYKLYFAYDETQIAELERACAASNMMTMENYVQASENFIDATERMDETIEGFTNNVNQNVINPRSTVD